MKDNLKNKMLASVLLGSITLGGCSGSGGGGSSTNPTTCKNIQNLCQG